MNGERLDPKAMLRSLGFEGAETVERVHGGADTALWRVERGGELYALRVFRPEQAETCRRETEAMRVAASRGLPVPPIYAVGNWRERPALLLGWCPGRTLLEELRARPWRAWFLGVLFGRMQARINALTAPEDFGRDATCWTEWAGPVDEELRLRLQRSGGCSRALLHLDYHPLNVMTDGTRITGVLDWANARPGDPRADYARTLSILRLDAGDESIRLHNLLVRAVVLAFELGWRRGYRQAAGQSDDLAPYYAWAGAMMVRDLGSRLRPRQRARIRAWTDRWRERAIGQARLPDHS